MIYSSFTMFMWKLDTEKRGHKNSENQSQSKKGYHNVKLDLRTDLLSLVRRMRLNWDLEEKMFVYGSDKDNLKGLRGKPPMRSKDRIREKNPEYHIWHLKNCFGHKERRNLFGKKNAQGFYLIMQLSQLVCNKLDSSWARQTSGYMCLYKSWSCLRHKDKTGVSNDVRFSWSLQSNSLYVLTWVYVRKTYVHKRTCTDERTDTHAYQWNNG